MLPLSCWFMYPFSRMEVFVLSTEARDWVVEEWGETDLGDKRRTARLIELATALADAPTASLPEALGSRADQTAAYRFFDNEAIDPDAILAGHHHALRRRLGCVPVVLAVQDTTEFHFAGRTALAGAGPLSNRHGHGFLAHSTLALTPQRVPLGLIAQQVWGRPTDAAPTAPTRKRRPIEHKESYKWLRSLQATIQVQAQCPQTRFVAVGDREADVYDLFIQDRPEGVDLLVRATQNRRVETAEGTLQPLDDHLAALAVATTVDLAIPPRPGQPGRHATMAVRFGRLHIQPPKHRAHERLPSVVLWGLEVVETAPPAGCQPLRWRLLTSWPIDSAEAAWEAVEWYACRWGIEVWHKVLKSGCRIEARQLETDARIKRCLAVYSVIAWRILYATMLARTLPDVPATALLDDDEWQALYCTIHDVATPPPQPPPLHTTVAWIGRLGGFVPTKSRPHPGVSALWRGFQHLTDLTKMYRILNQEKPTQKNVIIP